MPWLKLLRQMSGILVRVVIVCSRVCALASAIAGDGFWAGSCLLRIGSGLCALVYGRFDALSWRLRRLTLKLESRLSQWG